MAGYVVCPGCGDHLDPGERCDTCRAREQKRQQAEQLTEMHRQADAVAGMDTVLVDRVECFAKSF